MSVFEADCMERDRFCILCKRYQERTNIEDLEVHCIDPQGGYVKENGITLCAHHHMVVHRGEATPKFLYEMIASPA